MDGDIDVINVINKRDHVLIAITYKEKEEALLIRLTTAHAKELANCLLKTLGH